MEKTEESEKKKQTTKYKIRKRTKLNGGKKAKKLKWKYKDREKVKGTRKGKRGNGENERVKTNET